MIFYIVYCETEIYMRVESERKRYVRMLKMKGMLLIVKP